MALLPTALKFLPVPDSSIIRVLISREPSTPLNTNEVTISSKAVPGRNVVEATQRVEVLYCHGHKTVPVSLDGSRRIHFREIGITTGFTLVGFLGIIADGFARSAEGGRDDRMSVHLEAQKQHSDRDDENFGEHFELTIKE
jgi:hypothetical protein